MIGSWSQIGGIETQELWVGNRGDLKHKDLL